jgi:hypothetical protein
MIRKDVNPVNPVNLVNPVKIVNPVNPVNPRHAYIMQVQCMRSRDAHAIQHDPSYHHTQIDRAVHTCVACRVAVAERRAEPAPGAGSSDFPVCCVLYGTFKGGLFA